ncbi:MAG: response regulator transcription factor [Pseudomonadota bacterium]
MSKSFLFQPAQRSAASGDKETLGSGVDVRYGLIVEDLPDARDWLQAALGQAFPGIEIETAASLAEAREHTARRLPQVALIDIGLPDGSGIDLIGELNRAHPEVMSVVTSVFDDDTHLFSALGAGASGYLLKDQSREDLTQLLQRIAEGEPPLSPAIARRLLGFFGPRAAIPATSPQIQSEEDDSTRLTNRERDVLGLIAKGYTTAKVAEFLNITRNTASGYVKAIYRKLNISSRAEAALEASRRGIISPEVS